MAKKTTTKKTTAKAPTKKKAAPKVEEPVAEIVEEIAKPKPKAKPKKAKAEAGSIKKGAEVKYRPRNEKGVVMFSNSRGVVVDFGKKKHYCRYEDLEVA